ncbi:MAG: DUF1829 domain-containing protein [Nitrospirae bacterium]|nr:DUF1829 domain-containing protein [Nitrospirota bacterium]
MSALDCYQLVDLYANWLKEKVKLKTIGDICELTTPFVDRHNDYLQIYVKAIPAGMLLTDDGYTIRDLEMSGFEFNTERRKNELKIILNGFGVNLHGDSLEVEARPDNFPQKKHNLLQTMLVINDLFVLAPPKVASFFREDVERFLSLHDIRFTKDINFIGKSGFNHHFDFVIPPSKKEPERVLRTINNPTKNNVSAIIFSWDDARKVRSENSVAIAVLNDQDKEITPDAIHALKAYEIEPIAWSKRDKYIDKLTA